MKKESFIIFLFVFSTFISINAFANEDNLCNYNSLQYEYNQVDQFSNDKLAHCTFSCILQYRCGRVISFYSGIIKEVYDLFGPGSADYSDLKADFIGLEIAQTIENKKQCYSFCSDIFSEY